jgi:hypothetical protein
MLYTEFFAVLSLVFYAIENPEKPGSSEVLADARAGRKMIADLADKTQSAERVTSALKVCRLTRHVMTRVLKKNTGPLRSTTGELGHGTDTACAYQEAACARV